MTSQAERSLPQRQAATNARESALRLWLHDFASALRGLVHSPRYTLPALLSLGLGLGAATAVFSVFSALVLRPLPFAREAELVRIGTAREGGGGDRERVAAPFVRDFRALTDVFAAVAPYRQLGGRMDTPDGPHEFSPTITASNFFDTLGVQTEQGRPYTAQGQAPDGISQVELSHDRIDTSLGERSALERVLTAFGASALVLAVIGLFGVTSYSVAERSPEIAIRRALGASRRRILWMVLRETGTVVALGVAAGLLLTWLASGFLRAFLFQIGAADPLTYASICLGIFVLALLAALTPALVATQISPSRALAER